MPTPEWKVLPPGVSYGDKVYVDIYQYETILVPIKRIFRKNKRHTYLGKDSSTDAWALSTDASKRLTFLVEEAPHGAFSLREYDAKTGAKGHDLVYAIDWINFTRPENGENESLGWLPASKYFPGSDVDYDTDYEPFLLYFWAAGEDWPVNVRYDAGTAYLSFKQLGGEELGFTFTKVDASSAGTGAVRSKL